MALPGVSEESKLQSQQTRNPDSQSAAVRKIYKVISTPPELWLVWEITILEAGLKKRNLKNKKSSLHQTRSEMTAKANI
jgi:hypothetical protein